MIGVKFVISLAGALLAGVLSAAQAAEISLSCGAVGQELEICRQGAKLWEQKTGNTVKIISTPTSATERLALYQQILAAGSTDIDVFQIDVIWPGILFNHFIDLKSYAKGAEAEHFPSIVANNTIDGKLIAIPWYTDVGLLYYRKDLLEKHGAKVPSAWTELTETAKKIQDAERQAGANRMWGLVFQGKAYEGLTCNALEWIDSYGGGTIIDAAGKATVNNPKAVAALTLAASWIGTIAPDGVLNYEEEEARGVFQTGNAVFMRNWPYAWALANGADSPIKGKVGVAVLPKGGDGGKNTGTLGGWQLAVSKYSKNPELAADLTMFLTSKEEQKRRALAAAYNPTVAELYKDAEILAANPFFADLVPTLMNAVARPSKQTGAQYNRASSEVFNAVHDALSKKEKPEQALQRLERSLARIARRS